MARGYTANDGRHTPTNFPPSFSVSAGLTTSALDAAAFSMAMDRNALIKPESKALAWSPTVTPAGDTLSYGAAAGFWESGLAGFDDAPRPVTGGVAQAVGAA
jgi:hypothetical protein